MADPFQLDWLYDSKWKKYAAEAGIEDPWAKYRKNTPRSVRSVMIVDGKEIPCWETSFPVKEIELAPSDEERIAYRRQEFLWKAKIIQPKIKWDDLWNGLNQDQELNLRIFVHAIRKTVNVISCAQNLEKNVILENRKYFSRKRGVSCLRLLFFIVIRN